MNWLKRIFKGAASSPGLTAGQREKIEAWQALQPGNYEMPHCRTRYVVVDVEASGLNLGKDRLISIGAVAMNECRIDNRDAFQVVLRQDKVSTTENILIHGIGGSEQRAGIDPPDALLAFLEFIGKAPLVAYHASFDQIMIDRAMKEYLGFTLDNPWIDLAWILPEFFNQYSGSQIALDTWMALFGIENIQRHNAVSDAYATARLLQVVVARASQRGAEMPKNFIDLEKIRRWMKRSI